MEDTFFAKTVVLLCDYSDEGAIGVITNRTTDVTASEVLEQMEVADLGGIREVVRWGGPVQPGAVFLTFDRHDCTLVTRDVESLEDDEESEEEPAFAITERVRVSPSRGLIEDVAGHADRAEAFLTLGYAGWGAGQLDKEIQSGSWILLEPDEELVFRVEPEEQWEHCIRSLGIQKDELWMHPVEE